MWSCSSSDNGADWIISSSIAPSYLTCCIYLLAVFFELKLILHCTSILSSYYFMSMCYYLIIYILEEPPAVC